MLTIRTSQMEALRQSARRQFVRDVVSLLREHFPSQGAGLDERRLAAEVQYAITAAEDKGIRARANICKFVILLFAFGDQSLRNPAHFLYEALSPEAVSDEDIDDLYDRLLDSPPG